MTYTDIYFLSDISHICTVSAGSLKHGFILEKKKGFKFNVVIMT